MYADRYELRHTCARYQVGNRGAKLETEAKTEHGRPDQNTNARKLSEREGSGGTVQSDMKTGRTGYEKYGPSREKGRRSTVTVARQVWVQRAAHSKRVARKKLIPKKAESQKWGSCSFVFLQAGRRRHTQIRA